MTKQIAEIRDLINQQHADALMVLGDNARQVKTGFSSGSLRLNYALSGNYKVGYAWGRIVEIYGPEQSGKTTLALHALVAAQKLGHPCAFVDAEHALDVAYARNVGVDTKNLLFHQPDYGEQAITVLEELIRAGVRVAVVDSVAALTPKAELEGNVEDAHMGLQARLMGKAMRRLVALLSKSQATVIFLNQIRVRPGITFGNPEETSGGRALKFFASYRLEVRAPRGGADKSKSLTGDVEETGIESKIKVVKNKLYPPFRSATVMIRYGQGIDRLLDVATFLADYQKQLGEGKDGRVTIAGKSYKVAQLASLLERSANVRKATQHLLEHLPAVEVPKKVEEKEEET